MHYVTAQHHEMPQEFAVFSTVAMGYITDWMTPEETAQWLADNEGHEGWLTGDVVKNHAALIPGDERYWYRYQNGETAFSYVTEEDGYYVTPAFMLDLGELM